jgi:hypothetical protein
VQFAVILAAVVAIMDWVAGIARRKGYMPLLGVLLAVFFNVLGIVVLLLLPRRHRAGGHEE